MTYLCKNREFWKFLEPIRAFYNQSVSKQIGMGIHIFALGAIHKGCPHIGRGGGSQPKWTNADWGRGRG